MITKKENNINLRNMSAQLQEKERAIMKRKIEFLEMQIAEGGKRETALRRDNDQLRKALDQVTQDKQRVIGMIGDARTKHLEARIQQQQREHQELMQRYSQQQAKLEQITTFLGEKYQQELKRVEQLADQRLESLREQSRTELVYYEKKTREYQKTIERLSKLYQQSAIPTTDRLNTLMLDTSSSFLGASFQTTNKREELNNSSSSIHLQSFSTIIPEANITSSMHQDIPMKTSLGVKPLLKKEPAPLLFDSDLEQVSMGRHSAYVGEPRESINRSKSIMLLDSDFTASKKQKTIATSLFCTTCSQDYPPNEYYRHIKGCENNAREIQELIAKRQRIDKEIHQINCKDRSSSDIEDVVVVLKKRKEPPATSRVSMTSRPKLR